MHRNGANVVKAAIKGMVMRHSRFDHNQVAERFVCFSADRVFMF